MASGTINFNKSKLNSSNSYILGKIEYSYTQSTSDNTSTIKCTVYIKKDNDNTKLTQTTNGTFKYSIKINEETITDSKYLEILTDYKEIGSFTRTIQHDNDGSKEVNITGSVYLSSNSSSAYYNLPSEVDYNLSFATIPRASSITSASDVTLGNKCNIKWKPLKSSFVYKLKFTCGDVSYTTGYISPNTTSAYTYTGYTMSSSTWAKAMSNSYSATCKVVLYTYASESASGPMGSDSTTFKLTLSSNTQPSITNFSATCYDGWKGSDNKIYYLQGKSKCYLECSFSEGAGSSIESCSISGPGISLNGSSNSLKGYTKVLTQTGELTYTAKVTDSRSKVPVEATKLITVYPYANPILSIRVEHSTYGGIQFTYKTSCSSVNLKNYLVNIQYYYKYASSETWKSMGDHNLNSNGNTLSDSGWAIWPSLGGEQIDPSKSYDFKVVVTDAVGSSTEAIASISSAFRIFNIKKSEDGTQAGVSIGKLSENYIFDCALEARFLQNVEFGKNVQGNLRTNQAAETDGTLRNIVYIETGENSEGGEKMALAIHNKSVYVPNEKNNGIVNLGSSGRKWNQLYAVNDTISTSDEKVKTNIMAMSDTQEQLFNKLKPVTYKFINGTSDRTHYGFISQDVESSLNELDLTGKDFAGFCKDIKIDGNGNEILDENGNKVYDYSLRYAEFIALNTYMIQKLQNEIAELKAEIAELKSN